MRCHRHLLQSSFVFFTFTLVVSSGSKAGLQRWLEQPRYTEVNPGGQVVLTCLVERKQGECRWEKDGSPLGIYPGKYEWAGSPEEGDCSLKIINANLEFDDGVWQCQVTPSSFNSKDALISDGAQLVVRESPNSVTIQRVGDPSIGPGSPARVIAKAGEDLELECVVKGGNPPATVRWFAKDQEISGGHTQENTRSAENERTWVTVSRLVLPVSKSDNGVAVRCMAEHPALDVPMSAKTSLVIHYPPTVVIETSSLDNLEDKKNDVTLKCLADSNPPSKVIWRKEGLSGVFGSDPEIRFSPVSRHTAGTYSCTAENAIGMSEAEYVNIDVKYPPVLLSIGPSKVVAAEVDKSITLTCEAEGNPKPRYQWLQKMPGTNEVRIRSYEQNLAIANTTYDHQGEFVCEASNEIAGVVRNVQSEPIRVDVSGAPRVERFSAVEEVRVSNGQDATLEVLFCANPLPSQHWYLNSGNAGDKNASSRKNIMLSAGSAHGRFVAESVRKAPKQNCYISSLRINGAHADDSHAYELRLTNHHGTDSHTVKLLVRDHVTQESLIAVSVGAILTLLLFILIVLYCCKAHNCCCFKNSKKEFKPTDLESERTDVESTHSSHVSMPPAPEKMSAIPPDALYSGHGHGHAHFHSQDEAVFNDSKESLRPESGFCSNLNRTQSSSTELHHSCQHVPQHHHHQSFQHHPYQQHHQTPSPHPFPIGPPRIVYNDLCFPKTSNYGSMKKKKNREIMQQQQQQQQHYQQHQEQRLANNGNNGSTMYS